MSKKTPKLIRVNGALYRKAAPEFEKYIRNGKVGVIYSPGFGGGWNNGYVSKEEAAGRLMDKDLVELVLAGKAAEAAELSEERYNEPLSWRDKDVLKVQWVPVGSRFVIRENDGNEHVEIFNEGSWHVA